MTEPTFHVALYQPEIPPNTGNIGRLCVGMGAMLHIIGPCAFDMSDKRLRRAGLDYWPHLNWQLHDDPAAFLTWLGDRQPWLLTKFGQVRFDTASYQSGEVLVIGNEVRGLPDDWHRRWPDRGVAIPMLGPIRSFNQANACAILVAHAVARIGALDGWQPSPRTAAD